MNYCPVCGEPSIEEGLINPENIKITKNNKEKVPPTDYQKLTAREKRKLTWEIAGIILLSGILVTSVIDYVINQSVSWSRYPVSISLIVFLNITVITFLYRHIFWAGALSWVSTCTGLLFWDWITDSFNWSLELGIPILTILYIIVLALIFIIHKLKKLGLNIIVYALIATGIFCLCVEAIISLYTKEHIKLEWSIIVVASVIPVAFLLFILHQRLKRKTDLKRFFHI